MTKSDSALNSAEEVIADWLEDFQLRDWANRERVSPIANQSQVRTDGSPICSVGLDRQN